MNDDRDVGNALKLALADAPAYRAVAGFEQSGAVSISCFAVADEVEAQIVVRGSRWAVYGLASVARLRSLDCVLVPTDVYDAEDRLPLSDRHVDVIVCPYPPGTEPYAALARADRARLRADLEPRFGAVLRAFDPRRSLGDPDSLP